MTHTPEHECWTHFDPAGRSPLVHDAPDGWTAQQWHADASADTGTGHYPLGRMYVVACEWCRCTFLAQTKRAAMALFRAHEDEMLPRRTSPEGEAAIKVGDKVGVLKKAEHGHIITAVHDEGTPTTLRTACGWTFLDYEVLPTPDLPTCSQCLTQQMREQ